MAHDAKSSRPLSPHLQIYRWPVTMATSIFHRVTGVALYAGTVFLTWWLIAAASTPEAYIAFKEITGNFLGVIVLLGYSWALLYHLINGIRHLIWDTGNGFDNETVERTGILVIVLSGGVTLALWLLAVYGRDLT